VTRHHSSTTTKRRPITYKAFLGLVERAELLAEPEAQAAIRATLRTLGERLSPGETRDLAVHLAPELAALLINDNKAQRLDLEEFLRRVAAREGIDIDLARDHALAVFRALQQAVPEKELADAAAELPKEFSVLVLGEQPLA
jgi:uncharacterized protein (DUF2267 family)